MDRVAWIRAAQPWLIIIQNIYSAHISNLLKVLKARIHKHRGKPLLFHDKCPGFFYVHYTTHGTYSFTSHPKGEAIMVKCLAQWHKRRDRPGRDSNPHSDNTRTQVQCSRPLGHGTQTLSEWVANKTQINRQINFPKNIHFLKGVCVWGGGGGEGGGVPIICLHSDFVGYFDPQTPLKTTLRCSGIFSSLFYYYFLYATVFCRQISSEIPTSLWIYQHILFCQQVEAAASPPPPPPPRPHPR